MVRTGTRPYPLRASNLLTFYGVITDPLRTPSKPTIQAYQLLLPLPQFTTFGGDSPAKLTRITTPQAL
jgi:hypothetical protein